MISSERRVNYYAHKFEAEQDLFYNLLHFSHANTSTILQVGNTDLFYAAFYFSDGTITDINLYYVKSVKLKKAIEQSRIIRFSPGNGEWVPTKGDLKETYAWFFVSRIISSTSKEVEAIKSLEKSHNVPEIIIN